MFNTNLYSSLVVQVHKHSLRLSIRAQSMFPHLPSKATFLRPAKWARVRDRTNAIDADYARIHGRADFGCSLNVLGKDTGHQTISTIVRTSNDLILVVKVVDDDHRNKDLLFVYAGSLGRVCEDCWFDVEALSLC